MISHFALYVNMLLNFIRLNHIFLICSTLSTSY